MKTAEVRRLISEAKAAAKRAYAETTNNAVAADIEDTIFLLERVQHGMKRGQSIYTDNPEADVSGKKKPTPAAVRPRPDRTPRRAQPDLFGHHQA